MGNKSDYWMDDEDNGCIECGAALQRKGSVNGLCRHCETAAFSSTASVSTYLGDVDDDGWREWS